jgi:hypothetical protein
MWDPQRLTTLWAFTACYRDSLNCHPISSAKDVSRSFQFSESCWLRLYSTWLLSASEGKFAGWSRPNLHWKHAGYLYICMRDYVRIVFGLGVLWLWHKSRFVSCWKCEKEFGSLCFVDSSYNISRRRMVYCEILNYIFRCVRVKKKAIAVTGRGGS